MATRLSRLRTCCIQCYDYRCQAWVSSRCTSQVSSWQVQSLGAALAGTCQNLQTCTGGVGRRRRRRVQYGSVPASHVPLDERRHDAHLRLPTQKLLSADVHIALPSLRGAAQPQAACCPLRRAEGSGLSVRDTESARCSPWRSMHLLDSNIKPNHQHKSKLAGIPPQVPGLLRAWAGAAAAAAAAARAHAARGRCWRRATAGSRGECAPAWKEWPLRRCWNVVYVARQQPHPVVCSFVCGTTNMRRSQDLSDREAAAGSVFVNCLLANNTQMRGTGYLKAGPADTCCRRPCRAGRIAALRRSHCRDATRWRQACCLRCCCCCRSCC